MSERPLTGRTILLTRSRKQSGTLKQQLETQGATTISIPTIEIVPRTGAEVDEAVRSAADYDWIFFTSANGAEIFFRKMEELKIDPTSLPNVCSIGPATTRAVESFGRTVDLQPDLFQAEGILEEFRTALKGKISGLRILLPRAARARKILPETLRDMGARIDVVAVYDTVIPESNRVLLKSTLATKPIDLITLTSSSTVRHLVEMTGRLQILRRFRFASIGPITSETAAEFGLEVVLQPEKSTIPDMVAAIVDYFGAYDGKV